MSELSETVNTVGLRLKPSLREQSDIVVRIRVGKPDIENDRGSCWHAERRLGYCLGTLSEVEGLCIEVNCQRSDVRDEVSSATTVNDEAAETPRIVHAEFSSSSSGQRNSVAVTVLDVYSDDVDDKVDGAGWNVPVSEVGKRRRRRVDDTRRWSALTCSVRVPDVYRSDGDRRATEIIYNNIQRSSGWICRIDWD